MVVYRNRARIRDRARIRCSWDPSNRRGIGTCPVADKRRVLDCILARRSLWTIILDALCDICIFVFITTKIVKAIRARARTIRFIYFIFESVSLIL